MWKAVRDDDGNYASQYRRNGMRLTTVSSAATSRLRKVVGWQTALFAGCSKIGHGRCETPASRRIAFARCGPFAT